MLRMAVFLYEYLLSYFTIGIKRNMFIKNKIIAFTEIYLGIKNNDNNEAF